MPTHDKIPATMQAFVLKGHGDMDQLVYHTDWTTPQPGPGEVLLKVHACGLNNTDVNTRTAWYSKGVSENTTGGAFDGADDKVQKAGPTAILPRSPDNPKSALKKAIGQQAVTVVADVVGGPDWPRFIDVIARGERYTCAGAIAGPMIDFDLRTFYLRDLTFTCATIVPPGVFADFVSYIASDEIKPMLAATYPLVDLHEAQQAFIDKQHVGNIVVTMD